MHTWLQRANAALALGITALFALVLVIVTTSPILTFYWRPAPSVDLSVARSIVTITNEFRNAPARPHGVLFFNLDADLSSLFHWNTKQVNIYVAVEYTTPAFEQNSLIIWDDIVRSADDAVLRLESQEPDYWLLDIRNQLAHANVSVALHWHIVPSVGAFLSGHSTPVPHTLPAVQQLQS